VKTGKHWITATLQMYNRLHMGIIGRVIIVKGTMP